MDKRIMLYIRSDGLYVIPDGITTEGANLQTEPFEYLSLDSRPEEIWDSIEKAFLNANRRVPHPKIWNTVTAWYQKAGVKTWGQFAGKGKVMSIAHDTQNYSFKSLRWEQGSLISQKETMIVIPKGASRDRLIDTLKQYIY